MARRQRGVPRQRSCGARRAIASFAVAATAIVAPGLTGAAQAALSNSHTHMVTSLQTGHPTVLGLLGVSGKYYATEKANGIAAVTVDISWANAEPVAGRYSTPYLTTIRQRLAAARAAGLAVVVDPGLQYTPAWVFALPGGTRFIDQYGQVFTGPAASGDDVANAVTDLNVRAAEATYLRWLAKALHGSPVLAVRVGGGPLGELRYPDTTYQGRSNCFWAYDESTQAASTVRGWVPGTGTPRQAALFLAAYNNNLVRYGDWLDSQVGADFGVPELVMLPGWGERPGAAALETASRLTLDRPEFNEGSDWSALLASLPRASESVAYSTYLDAPSFSSTAEGVDPMDFIASLAKHTVLRLGGESSSGGNEADLDLMVKRALRLHLVIVDWFDEAAVVGSSASHADSAPSFSDLRAAAAELTHGP